MIPATDATVMLAPVTHILPMTNLRRARLLPAPGRVLVYAGQTVSAIDVVAETQLSNRHLSVDLRRALGVSSPEEAEACLVRQKGDRLQKGDVLAERGRLFTRVVRAPVDGEILLINHGQVLLKIEPQPLQLLAAVPGRVTEVVPELGVIIETDGALIQAMWGNGKVDSGLLLNLASEPSTLFTRTSLDPSMRGAVALAGCCDSADALRAAAETQLRGLILGSMTADLIPVAQGLNLPVVLLDGFGRQPLNEVAYRLLTTSEKRDVSVNAAWNPDAGERPEVIVPLPAAGQRALETANFEPGQRVRVQGQPYQGRTGELTRVKPGLTTLPNGVRVQAAEIRLDDEQLILAPLANLEVLA